ncbi:MAG: Asp-tRNA(Asn)/Glu-tRNA(Gln) amidotransferase GatCAB subunit C, partial [Spirochaetes bacterium]|nr:Asp-tRNA(Asn)/Glu-tRNA(Gln) amidotransferase GatCAB subunit C [Spirochaetota bacterium]
ELARIELSDAEREQLAGEIDAIIAYVSAVQEIAGEATEATPTVGPLHNVFRTDMVTNAPETYTEDLLAAMPSRDGRYLKVQKILSQDE